MLWQILLSLEELSLEIGWRQLYDEHAGSDVIETSAEPEMGAPVSRRLIESDDAGDETLGNAPNREPVFYKFNIKISFSKLK